MAISEPQSPGGAGKSRHPAIDLTVPADQTRQGFEVFAPAVVAAGLLGLVGAAAVAMLIALAGSAVGWVLVVVVPPILMVVMARRAIAADVAPLIARLGATPLDPTALPLVAEQAISTAATVGVPEPTVYVIETDAQNIATLGLGPDRAAVIVTSGLCASLAPIELEAVFGWAGVQVHRGDYIAETRAAIAAAVVPWWLAPVRSMVDRRAADITSARTDETTLACDLQTVAVTRFPPGFAAALDKIAGSSAIPGVDQTTRGRWIMDPTPSSDSEFGPPAEIRIALLREL